MQHLISFQYIKDQWELLKNLVTHAAEGTIPKIKVKGRNMMMTEGILKIIEENLNNKDNHETYEVIRRTISQLCKEAKEAWFDEKFSKREKQYST